MTPPPPSDPIRPLGPVAGGMFVDRTRLTEQLRRRRRRGDDEGSGDRRHGGAGDGSGGDEQALGHHRPATPIRDPRAYDDHGRRTTGDDPHAGDPHVDASA
jgi:hypothetical protein